MMHTAMLILASAGFALLVVSIAIVASLWEDQ